MSLVPDDGHIEHPNYWLTLRNDEADQILSLLEKWHTLGLNIPVDENAAQAL
jgi:hypothetical protein